MKQKKTQTNIMKLTLPSISVNEGVARSVIGAFCSQLDPTIEELAECTGMSYSITANIAAMLETDGLISIDLLQRCFIMVEKFR